MSLSAPSKPSGPLPRRSGTLARRRLGQGLGLALLGIALSVGTREPLAAYVTLLGTLWALYGLHALGRSGPDD